MEKNQYKTLKAIYGISESYSNLLLCSNSVLVQQRHQFLNQSRIRVIVFQAEKLILLLHAKGK